MKDNGQKFLKGVAQASKQAAIYGKGWGSWFGFYQPELPEKLKQLGGKEKNK